MPKSRKGSKVTFRARNKGGVSRFLFTKAQEEVMELAMQPPYRTYAQIAQELTKLHPRKKVTESAIKQRMSRAGVTALLANAYQKKWYEFTRTRKKLRRGEL
jgi:hypothetical protein